MENSKYDLLKDFTFYQKQQSTGNIFNIMQIQCDDIKKITDNKVQAQFSQMKFIRNEQNLFIQASNQVSNTFNQINNALPIHMGHFADCADDKEDVGTVNEQRRYGFVIYNDKYKCRLASFIISFAYPITVELDVDIAIEKQDKLLITFKRKGDLFTYHDKEFGTGFILNSEDDLLECLRIIFESNKFKQVMFKLNQLPVSHSTQE